jgi:hypothetical protein
MSFTALVIVPVSYMLIGIILIQKNPSNEFRARNSFTYFFLYEIFQCVVDDVLIGLGDLICTRLYVGAFQASVCETSSHRVKKEELNDRFETI